MFMFGAHTKDIRDFASEKASGVLCDGTDDSSAFAAANQWFRDNPSYAGPAGSLWAPRINQGYKIDTPFNWWTDYGFYSNGAQFYTEGCGTSPAIQFDGSSRYPHPQPVMSNCIWRGLGNNIGATSAPGAFGPPMFNAGTAAISTALFSGVKLEGVHFLNYDQPIKFIDRTFVIWFRDCSVSGCNYAFKWEGGQFDSGQDLYWDGGLIQHTNYGFAIGTDVNAAIRLTVSNVSFTFLRKSYVPVCDNRHDLTPGLLQFNNCLFEGTTAGGPKWDDSTAEPRFKTTGLLRFDKSVFFDHNVHPWIPGTVWFDNEGKIGIRDGQWHVNDVDAGGDQQIVGAGNGKWDVSGLDHYADRRVKLRPWLWI